MYAGTKEEIIKNSREEEANTLENKRTEPN
jgi:hypothetical protein